MSIMEIKLQPLTEKLLKEVIRYGILEVSVDQYRYSCKSIIRFAENVLKQDIYSRELCELYLEYLDERVDKHTLCSEYRRFQRRVIRMLMSLAEDGAVDFSRAKQSVRKYPVPEHVSELIEDILDTHPINEKTKNDLRAPIRHVFWYALQKGLNPEHMDDRILMEFLIHEVPISNGGSTGRTLRCVKYLTEYLKLHGNSNIKYDYSQLTLKNDHRRIIPSFSEEEIANITASTDVSTPLGKRDRAIILLAYCTGLRGADIIRVKLSDIDWRGQKISVIQSKTHTPVIAELNGETLNALADYILDARPKCTAAELFITTKAPYRGFSAGFGKMIDKYCEKAGVRKIPSRAFHSLRRSFETVMVSKGVPIETASHMMGHKSITEDKPYITHDKSRVSFVAIDFSEVPITSGFYAFMDPDHSLSGGDEK